MEIFLPTGKKRLSGDGRAHFEVVFHGRLWMKGSRFRVQRSVQLLSVVAVILIDQETLTRGSFIEGLEFPFSNFTREFNYRESYWKFGASQVKYLFVVNHAANREN